MDLDEVKPEGSYVLLNPWMAIPERDAKKKERESHEAGDKGVVAVPLSVAMSAMKVRKLLLRFMRQAESMPSPWGGPNWEKLCSEAKELLK